MHILEIFIYFKTHNDNGRRDGRGPVETKRNLEIRDFQEGNQDVEHMSKLEGV